MEDNINVLDVSVPKLAKQLEAKSVGPDGIPELTRLECAWYLKSRGRSTSEAAVAVGLHEKKVQRYFHDKKEELRLQFGPEFQADIVSDFVYGWKAHRQRLLKLADTEDMPIHEEIKIIALLHQLDKDSIEILGKLGYLSREFGQEEVSAATQRRQIMQEIFDEDKAKQKLAEQGGGSAPALS